MQKPRLRSRPLALLQTLALESIHYFLYQGSQLDRTLFLLFDCFDSFSFHQPPVSSKMKPVLIFS